MELVNDSPRVLGNRYEVGDLLGRGGMAEVHLGRDTRLGRTVAIKLLRSDLARDPTFQARFRREAQSAAALNHPAIVAVYDTGEEMVTEAGGATVSLPYIVMEYIEGRTLRDVLIDGRTMDVDLALDVTTGVLAALEYSHRIGIVHRDIKPANVMLTPQGEIKVMDFGIARAMADASSTMTQTQAVIGTAQYLSPEQARGEQVDTRSDLYSAGCLLFELLTGRPPFVADSPVAVAYQHVREQPPTPSTLAAGIPDSVDRIVLHSLAKDREDRYQSAADFRADVEAARGGRQVAAPVPVPAGAEATTQYMGATGAPTGATRAMAPVGAGAAGAGLLGQGPPTGPQQMPFEDTYGNRYDDRQQRDRGPWMAILIGLVVLALVGGVTYLFLRPDRNTGGTAATTQATVPDVGGSERADAVAEIEAAKLVPDINPQETQDENEVGKVIAQTPAAGAEVDQGSTVRLTVGVGPEDVTVPDVSGDTEDEALGKLQDAGLKIGARRTEQSTEFEAGEVTRTDPEAGSTVEPGTTVIVYLANAQVRMPEVTGKTEDDAREQLEALDLKVRVQQEPNGDAAAGSVIDQNPAPNSVVRRGQTVTIVVAEEPEEEEEEPTTPPPSTASPTGSPTPTTPGG